ncbi:Transcription factor jumonji aspartyl beta-hydroxylase [Fusarium agapanthi]|uniref:Transcription factor jumonji aspartyl beta-hydroxylase n=1 Tax=Fusarium agapanthi TaxID=1803897 RepID=A0A9P5B8K5_9HYPO|nr:Transcription factor jumonji aspartyl beta-hydroxylase [Fusarium agapanthi]
MSVKIAATDHARQQFANAYHHVRQLGEHSLAHLVWYVLGNDCGQGTDSGPCDGHRGWEQDPMSFKLQARYLVLHPGHTVYMAPGTIHYVFRKHSDPTLITDEFDRVEPGYLELNILDDTGRYRPEVAASHGMIYQLVCKISERTACLWSQTANEVNVSDVLSAS